ncbi:pleiotropic drug resistance protein 3-like [Gossypium australe]|uniref:Pleiotropic drug resistance protein 3-like n=1 Tax=Gossypium australe TaxID=47621 RepID=A0A5B6VTF8_9ROSI|nr:pleiotropic drug resistance protein 3-like [Gossypium australe]
MGPQNQGFVANGEEYIVCKLKKALYGLKQALQTSYKRVDEHLDSLGFEKSVDEPTLYVKKEGNKTPLIVSLYVGDLLVTGSGEKLLTEFKKQMRAEFEMLILEI